MFTSLTSAVYYSEIILETSFDYIHNLCLQTTFFILLIHCLLWQFDINSVNYIAILFKHCILLRDL